MIRTDTHLHLLSPDKLTYPWLAGAPALQRAWTWQEYWQEALQAGVAEALFVEVDVDPADIAREAHEVRLLAAEPGCPVTGIIAACRPESEEFDALMAQIEGPGLKGVRRVLHTLPDALSQSSRFRANVRVLGSRGLTFDLCVLARQLPLGIELADACPQTRIVLDHCGVPDIAGYAYESWSGDLARLAQRENVFCKLSGLPAYCPPGSASAAILRPWVEHAIECFGWHRIVWGSDWPLCTLHSSTQAWCNALDEIVSEASLDEQEQLYSHNARTIYGL